MIEFNIDRVQKELDGKYNLSHLIVNRVKRLRAGVESKVEKKMRENKIALEALSECGRLFARYFAIVE